MAGVSGYELNSESLLRAVRACHVQARDNFALIRSAGRKDFRLSAQVIPADQGNIPLACFNRKSKAG